MKVMVFQWPDVTLLSRALAFLEPALERCHVGLDPGFIDEDKA